MELFFLKSNLASIFSSLVNLHPSTSYAMCMGGGGWCDLRRELVALCKILMLHCTPYQGLDLSVSLFDCFIMFMFISCVLDVILTVY